MDSHDPFRDRVLNLSETVTFDKIVVWSRQDFFLSLGTLFKGRTEYTCGEALRKESGKGGQDVSEEALTFWEEKRRVLISCSHHDAEILCLILVQARRGTVIQRPKQ
jgi:hypothetical protein